MHHGDAKRPIFWYLSQLSREREKMIGVSFGDGGGGKHGCREKRMKSRRRCRGRGKRMKLGVFPGKIFFFLTSRQASKRRTRFPGCIRGGVLSLRNLFESVRVVGAINMYSINPSSLAPRIFLIFYVSFDKNILYLEICLHYLLTLIPPPFLIF